MKPGMMRAVVKREMHGAVGMSFEVRGLGAAVVLLAGVLAACLLSCGGCSEGGASEGAPRADLIEIGVPGPHGELERPPVQFPHDKHTEALAAEGKDCSTCHLAQENGYLSPLYMRLDNALVDEAEDDDDDSGEDHDARSHGDDDGGSGEDAGDWDVDGTSGDDGAGSVEGGLMELYHDNCLACHAERAEAGGKTGPLACGDCHRKEPAYVSSTRAFGMDKSLHYRHSVARSDKCEDCHHTYDETAKKLVYVKGTESSCRDCHRGRTEDDMVAFKAAAHWACIKCHIETSKLGPDVAVGPRACGGCHDPESQRAIKVVADVPRLVRNQPDFVLISAPEDEIESSKFRTVPFPHMEHEGATSSCRDCHHETLKSCPECHTLSGEEEGGGVMLQTAMHLMTSNHSCVGCHELQKTHPGCAGCHDLMEKGRLSEHACGICHAGPSPQNLEAERGRYTSVDDFQPDPSSVKLTFRASDIPDSVVISVLSKEYEPAVMPHGRIVNKLSEYIRDSKVATHFHGREDVVCQGCHHNGSIGERPALCENCHGRPFDAEHLYRPGLYGAYHRQCLGCHESMGLKKPSDCAGCHQKKQAATG